MSSTTPTPRFAPDDRAAVRRHARRCLGGCAPFILWMAAALRFRLISVLTDRRGGMLEQEDRIPSGVDPDRANVARVYDYLLGGTHNFGVDRDGARTLLTIAPTARDMAKANRAFLGRAVRFLAAAG